MAIRLIFTACFLLGKLYAQTASSNIPIHMLTGGVIIVPAKLGSFPDSLHFILDTGSGGISLDSNAVLRLGLKPNPSSIQIRGVAGIKKVGFIYNQTLHLPGLSIDSLNFHINDYAFLSSIYGIRIDGIIGYSLFSRFIVQINYDDSVMTLHPPGPVAYPQKGLLLKPAIKRLVVQQASLKDRRKIDARFLHDIGAGVSLMLSKDFVDDSTLLAENRRLWPKEGHGLGGKIHMDLSLIKELKFGPYRFKHVPVLIFDDVYDVTSYPYLGGLIGNDIFRRFNIIYNYPANEIHLSPNRSFHERFDYAYSGINLQLIEGKIDIGDVAQGSPADLAGVKQGDELLAVNEDFSGDFFRYQKALQKTQKETTLLIKRNGTLQVLKFRIKNIKKER